MMTMAEYREMIGEEPRNLFGVWCRVSGGVTGSRAAWLKQDGVRFEGTREEAEAEARRLREGNPGRYSSATFNYSAKEIDR